VVPTDRGTLLSYDWIADRKFFDLLDSEDARAAATVKAAGCPVCGGRLDRANYPRKPRGGEVGAAGEVFDRRRSFCCAREGCRRRRTPPSLVFFGRRVYLAITVVLACLRAAASRSAPPARRTLRRWRVWFAALPGNARFAPMRAVLSPPLEPTERLPDALLDRVLHGRAVPAAMLTVLRLLAPAVGSR
jgi:hypothetical protein